MKTAFIFPGQGAQYFGMAKEFYEQVDESREIFDIASDILDINMKKLCFEENDNLNKTEYTQAAMLTACVSILRAVEKQGINADIVAGLSLGEYSALVANNVLSFANAIKLVRKRGCYMENEVPNGVGSMAAILGLDNNTIEDICIKVSEELGKPVEPANYNCPGQVVISGEKTAVIEAGNRLKDAGARRVLELKVSGPFHSSLLKGAGIKLAEDLKTIELHKMTIPYVTNVTADIVTNEESSSTIKKYLEKQVYSPVKWQQSMENLITLGISTFIEIGPGKTLSGFAKKIDKTKTIINIDKFEDLQNILTLI